LNHWLTAVDTQIQAWAKSLPVGHLGTRIEFESGQQKKLPKWGVVIVGMESQSANAIRRTLYEFASLSEKLKICDLGNFRKTDTDFCLPLLQELLGAGHLVICIGAGEETGLTQFLAYRDFRRVSNLALVDHRVDLALKECPEFKSGVWQQVLAPVHKRLFHFCLLASQSHLMPEQIARFLDKKGFDHLRLGMLRADMAAAEPAIRDMDMLAINLRVLRSQAGDTYQAGTASGLTTEELCQLARYAGLSEKVSSISFFGSAESAARADAGAQAVWYFLEGVTHRCGDFPASVHGMTEYIVDMQKLTYQLTFWKSNRSGRWWVQVPVHIERNKERHKLVPCTYSDYQLASKEELSDRLMRAFERFM
jgi:formiminoglutamase